MTDLGFDLVNGQAKCGRASKGFSPLTLSLVHRQPVGSSPGQWLPPG